MISAGGDESRNAAEEESKISGGAAVACTGAFGEQSYILSLHGRSLEIEI